MNCLYCLQELKFQADMLIYWFQVRNFFVLPNYGNFFSLIQRFGLKTKTLSKPRRLKQRERGQTKGLMSASVVQHVRFKILYIS